MMVRILLVLVVGLAVPLSGCGLDRSRFEAPLEAEGPFVVGEHLAWLDAPRSRLLLLEAGAAPTISCLPIPTVARGMATFEDRLWLLGQGDSGPELLELHPGSGKRKRVSLPVLFDEIHLDPDASHALLLSDATRAPLPDEPVVRDLGRIGIADLLTGKVELIPLERGGLAEAALFSADGETAAVLLQRGVLLLDTRNPSHRRLAFLELPDGTSLHPQEAWFSSDGDFLAVRAEGADDLLVLSVRKTAASLDLSINLLSPPGRGPIRAMIRPSGEGLGDAVAVITENRISLLDLGGDTTKTLSRQLVGQPLQIVSLGGGPFFATGTTTGVEGEGLFVATWDPRTDRLDQARLDGSLLGVGSSEDRLFLLHTSPSGSTLTIGTADPGEAELRLRLRSLPISGVPSAMAVSALSNELLLGVGPGIWEWDKEWRDEADATAPGSLAVVRTGGLGIDGLTLDASITSVGTVGAYAWVLHPSPLGDLTLVPLGNLTRSASLRFENFFGAGLLGCKP